MSFISVKQNSITNVEIERSKFIGRAFAVKTEDEAQARLFEVRSLHPDATHNCYAYSVTGESGGEIVRFSDDGEPSGTAGMPILDVIQKQGLRNVLIVVTRYFGGIKLGAGGLTRAYSRLAVKSLESAGYAEFTEAQIVYLTVDYSQKARAERLVSAYDGVILKTKFEHEVEIKAVIPAENLQNLITSFSDLTCGLRQVKVSDSVYYSFEE